MDLAKLQSIVKALVMDTLKEVALDNAVTYIAERYEVNPSLVRGLIHQVLAAAGFRKKTGRRRRHCLEANDSMESDDKEGEADYSVDEETLNRSRRRQTRKRKSCSLKRASRSRSRKRLRK